MFHDLVRGHTGPRSRPDLLETFVERLEQERRRVRSAPGLEQPARRAEGHPDAIASEIVPGAQMASHRRAMPDPRYHAPVARPPERAATPFDVARAELPHATTGGPHMLPRGA